MTNTGLINPKCTAVIGNGVVVHIPSFFAELDALQQEGLSKTTTSVCRISDHHFIPQDSIALVVSSSPTALNSYLISTKSSMVSKKSN